MKNSLSVAIFLLATVLILSCSNATPFAEDVSDDSLDDNDVSNENDDTSIPDDDHSKKCEDSDEDIWDYRLGNKSVSKIMKYDDETYIILGRYSEMIFGDKISWSMISVVDREFNQELLIYFDEIGYGRNLSGFDINAEGEIIVVGTKYAHDYEKDSFIMLSLSKENGEMLWEKQWQYDNFEYVGHNILSSVIQTMVFMFQA